MLSLKASLSHRAPELQKGTYTVPRETPGYSEAHAQQLREAIKIVGVSGILPCEFPRAPIMEFKTPNSKDVLTMKTQFSSCPV